MKVAFRNALSWSKLVTKKSLLLVGLSFQKDLVIADVLYSGISCRMNLKDTRTLNKVLVQIL